MESPFDRRDRPNILVTGGAGFIGSHLCDRLVREAHVICVDNFSTSSLQNIDHLLQDPNFEFIHQDIVQPLDLESRPELARFEIPFRGIQGIYHLACPISKRHFQEQKLNMIALSSVGTRNVADLALKYGAPLVFASSSVLYGPAESGKTYYSELDPCRIDHLTTHGAYEEGKRFSESILYTYAELSNITVKVARIFRTFGPRMKVFDGNLIPDLVLSALQERDLLVPGTEETSVTLLFVSDLVDGLLKLMASPGTVQLMNLGSDVPVNLLQLARRIVESTGSTSQIRLSRPTGYEAGLPDLTRSREQLGWVPLVRWEDGLSRVIDYVRSHMHLIQFG